jgi:F5/8 type C domain
VKNLLVLRCGKNSLHRQWLEHGARNWDIILCPYQEIEAEDLPTFLIPGQKWSGLYEFLTKNRVWQEYNYICLPDDDIDVDAQTWSDFFDYCHRLNAKLAAPALTPNSYFSHHVTMQNMSFTARATSFVEIMNPCIRRDVLEQLLPTMQLSRAGTGFGLDFLWSAMMNYEDIWIVDQTPVHHTRPVGSARDGALAALSRYDLNFIGGLGIPFHTTSIGGVTKDGQYVSANDDLFTSLDFEGHSYLLNEVDRARLSGANLKKHTKPQPVPAALARLRGALEHLNQPVHSLSRGKPALISSLSQWSWTKDLALEASGANDGRINGLCGFHTAREVNPWWQVDLEAICAVNRIEIYNRLDQKSRLVNLNILSSLDGLSWRCLHAKRDDKPFGGADGDLWQVEFPTPVEARLVRIEALGDTYLHLDQVEVYGSTIVPNNTDHAGPAVYGDLEATSVVMLEHILHSPRGRFLLEQLVKGVLT